MSSASNAASKRRLQRSPEEIGVLDATLDPTRDKGNGPRRRLDAPGAALLRTGIAHRFFQEPGFSSGGLDVEAPPGYPTPRVRSIVTIESESRRKPHLPCGILQGEYLTSIQASALPPLPSEKHTAASIRRAREVTLRLIGSEVAWFLDPIGQPCSSPMPALPRIGTGGDATEVRVQNRAHRRWAAT